MISGYTFFKVYYALSLHFTSKYDAIKYCGKTPNSTFEKYEIRRDKAIFEKYGKRVKDSNEAGTFSVANFMHQENTWLYGDVENAVSIYKEWNKKHESLTHFLTSDFKFLNQLLQEKQIHYDNLFQKTPKGNKAPILQLYLANRILPDTICAFDLLRDGFLIGLEKDYDDDPLVKKSVFKLKKFKPFCKIKHDLVKKIHDISFIPWEN